MKTSIQSIQRFLRDEEGGVAIEYGLLATLIAIAIIVGATALGNGLNTLFQGLANCFTAPPTGPFCA